MRNLKITLCAILTLSVPALSVGQNQTGKRPIVVKGVIKELTVPFFKLEYDKDVISFALMENAQVLFSNKQPGKPSDLKVGQRVSVLADMNELGRKIDPAKGGTDMVVIEIEKNAVINQLFVWDEVWKREPVDFAKEYVLHFSWIGSGMDRFYPSKIEDGKEGPFVVFGFKGGDTKDRQFHQMVFSVSKNATWKGQPPLGQVTKVVDAETLSKVAPNFK